MGFLLLIVDLKICVLRHARSVGPQAQEKETNPGWSAIKSFFLSSYCSLARERWKEKRWSRSFPGFPSLAAVIFLLAERKRKRNGQQNEDDANDGFSLIAWRRFSLKRRSKRRLDRRLVSQELIVGLMKAPQALAHNSKLFEHLPMACPTFTWASASADIQAHVNTFSFKKM